MRILLLLLLSITATTVINAQKITGTITDDENKALEKATITLLKASDSSMYKMGVTDKSGTYILEGIKAGKYIVAATSVGRIKAFSETLDVTEAGVTVPAIILAKGSQQLSGVTVTAKKPMVEVKADKMIVNVEGTINAIGNDALELLRKSPGIVVDKDGGISMMGKNGVQVYIDGKPSPLSGEDLANYLRSMQSSNIESIELVTNPSAKYDAAGNAGIINIKLKKNKAYGTNGSVNAGANAATYGRYNAGINLNHRAKNFNFFGNYNFNKGLAFGKFGTYNALADSILNQVGLNKTYMETHGFKAGVDFFLTKRSTLGVMMNGNLSDFEQRSKGATAIAAVGQPVSKYLDANTSSDMNNKNTNYNINYKYNDTTGKELNVDADYGRYRKTTAQYIPNIYTGPDHQTVTRSNIYRITAPSDIDLVSIKADYEQPFLKGKLSGGFKVSNVSTDNDLKRYNVINNNDEQDFNNSNRFEYKETIAAIYANFNKQYKGFMIQAGLRGENTNAKGTSLGRKNNTAYDSTFDRNYFNLFPSAAITYNKNPMSTWNLNYSRRIDRPSYSSLNPFEFLLNDYMYNRGNVYLQPQFTNTFSLTHTYKYMLNTTLSYSHINDLFVQVMDSVGTVTYQTQKNLASQNLWNLNISMPYSKKWYTAFINVNTGYSIYKHNETKQKVDNFSAVVYLQNSFKLNKTLTAELTGLYLSPFIWQGMFKGKSMHSVDIGLQKTVLKGKGTLKASVADIFKGMKFDGEAIYGSANTVIAKWDSRQFKTSFAYRFGSNQVKAARQRKTGLEDENKRTAGGSSAPGQ